MGSMNVWTIINYDSHSLAYVSSQCGTPNFRKQMMWNRQWYPLILEAHNSTSNQAWKLAACALKQKQCLMKRCQCRQSGSYTLECFLQKGGRFFECVDSIRLYLKWNNNKITLTFMNLSPLMYTARFISIHHILYYK